jgi:hypothetical protein
MADFRLSDITEMLLDMMRATRDLKIEQKNGSASMGGTSRGLDVKKRYLRNAYLQLKV